MKKIGTVFLYISILILSLLFAQKEPQALFIPLSMLLWTHRARCTYFLKKFPVSIVFIGSTWLLGLTIELFAIWQNMPLPIGKRILFAQNPSHDLAISMFFYFLFAIIWYILLKRYSFTPRQVFFIQSIWSFVEQRGAVLFMALHAGLYGIILLLFVAGVYGTWIYFPTLFTQDSFAQKWPDRIRPTYKHFLLTLMILYGVLGLITII